MGDNTNNRMGISHKSPGFLKFILAWCVKKFLEHSRTIPATTGNNPKKLAIYWLLGMCSTDT